MKRRSFVKSAIISSAATAIIPATSHAFGTKAKVAAAEYFELRVYQLKVADQQKLVEDYLKSAFIPAANRAGVKHVGVFTEMKPTGQTKLYVLVQYNNLNHFNTVTEALSKDTTLKTNGEAYLNAPAKQPAYERIESSFLKAFTHWPAIVAPEKKARILELRQYQSASEAAGKRKADMFNNQGEIDIFKRLGFNPVFWGETVIGPQRPNLTYMLCFDDMDAKNAHWKAFGSDEEWHKISSIPENSDRLLVNKITSTMLVPAEYSQI